MSDRAIIKQSSTQLKLAKKGEPIPCADGCGKARKAWRMYRCYYCNLYRCPACAEKHFGGRRTVVNNVLAIKADMPDELIGETDKADMYLLLNEIAEYALAAGVNPEEAERRLARAAALSMVMCENSIDRREAAGMQAKLNGL